MEFLDREKEKEELKAILSWEPEVVYFVYGPINSGKTALLMKVFEELPEEYRVFYINFRWRDVERVEDLLRVLFRVQRGKFSEEAKEFAREILKGGAQVLSRLKGIPIPEGLFNLLFKSEEKVEDIFAYLEGLFEGLNDSGVKPVLVLDEMQTIKEIINAAGRPVLSSLFNFMVGMTKETHLSHCLCATSDGLFIEEVYSNARLEGRAEYILVDDLDRDRAYEMYGKLGIEDKGLVWEYVGGKIGDIRRVVRYKRRGYSEKDTVKRLVKEEASKLELFLGFLKYADKEVEFRGKRVVVDRRGIEEGLKIFKEREEVEKGELEEPVLWALISENVLFYNPVSGVVRPQGRLLWHAIREVV